MTATATKPSLSSFYILCTTSFCCVCRFHLPPPHNLISIFSSTFSSLLIRLVGLSPSVRFRVSASASVSVSFAPKNSQHCTAHCTLHSQYWQINQRNEKWTRDREREQKNILSSRIFFPESTTAVSAFVFISFHLLFSSLNHSCIHSFSNSLHSGRFVPPFWAIIKSTLADSAFDSVHWYWPSLSLSLCEYTAFFYKAKPERPTQLETAFWNLRLKREEKTSHQINIWNANWLDHHQQTEKKEYSKCWFSDIPLWTANCKHADLNLSILADLPFTHQQLQQQHQQKHQQKKINKPEHKIKMYTNQFFPKFHSAVLFQKRSPVQATVDDAYYRGKWSKQTKSWTWIFCM